jgi:hypothetical protein
VQHITTQKKWKPVGQSRQDRPHICTFGLEVFRFQTMAVAPVKRRYPARNAAPIVYNAKSGEQTMCWWKRQVYTWTDEALQSEPHFYGFSAQLFNNRISSNKPRFLLTICLCESSICELLLVYARRIRLLHRQVAIILDCDSIAG